MRRTSPVPLALVALLLPVLVAAAEPDVAADAVARGKRIYRDGSLDSGEVLTAVVERDVPVQGTQLTCVQCHQRSGMGTSEGARVVPPIAGPFLYQPAEAAPRARPAYDDVTLARAIRDGIDAAGRPLDPLMPRYRLAADDLEALIAYLKTLSTAPDAGVTATTVRFATVIADDADPVARDAMLAVLDTFFREKNGETRQEPARAVKAPTFTANRAYRRWLLDRWTLHGPPETWRGQLEAAYGHEPVFALLSGTTAGPWRPIHEFCEAHGIPCLLPNTDLPVVDGDDFYTLYFSKGLALEAQVIAEQLVGGRVGVRVLQVFEQEGSAPVAADALRRALAGRKATIVDLVVSEEASAADQLRTQMNAGGNTVIVLWLSPGGLARLAASGWRDGATPVYLSSTLLDGELTAVPPSLRAGVRVVHLFSLPDDLASRLRRVQSWLRARGIERAALRVQAQTYFACLVAGEGLMHVKWFLHRDYLLDAIDHLPGAAGLSAYHPRIGFGPGQRYLAKGAYVLILGPDEARPGIQRATWVGVGG